MNLVCRSVLVALVLVVVSAASGSVASAAGCRHGLCIARESRVCDAYPRPVRRIVVARPVRRLLFRRCR